VPKFRNIGADVHAIKRADLGGQLVEAGSDLEVAGDVTGETDDAYIVGEGDSARAWPKSQWELVKPAAKAASVKEN
jgi:hypothetical protein